MPQNAIATGAVDFVAPPSRLVERLGEVAHSKDAVRSLDMDEAATASESRPEEVRRRHAELKSTQESLAASRSGHDTTIGELRVAYGAGPG